MSLCVLRGESLCRAGDLSPPAGPVAPTHKTLTDMEPRVAINATNTPGDADSVFKITTQGSYYLTGNVLAGVNRIAIEIAAGGVEVDLNGFSIVSFSSLPVIQVTLANQSNIVVRRGSINGAAGPGIEPPSPTPLAPSGVKGDGVSSRSTSMSGTSVAVGFK